MEEIIIDAISKEVGKSVNRWSTFRYMGIDDFSKRSQLINALCRKFNISISDYEISQFRTVGELIDCIMPMTKTKSESHTVGESFSYTTESKGSAISNTKSESHTVGESFSSTTGSEGSAISNTNSTINNRKSMDIEYKKKYEWAIAPDKTKHQYVIGIDFGHGETSAAYCVIGWGKKPRELEKLKDIELAGGYTIPSAITINSKGSAFIGNSAFEGTRLRDSIVHVHFKKRPKDIDGESEVLMMRYMREVYNLICEKNPGTFNREIGDHIVFIAAPSGWNEEEIDLYGRMAVKAGLPIGGIVPESQAAFIKAQLETDTGLPKYVENGAIVFDMGSSTLDFTYLRKGLDKPINWGDDCGASRVEKIMFENKYNKQESLRKFVEAHPDLKDAIIHHARKCKEDIYNKEPNSDSKGGSPLDFCDIAPWDEEFEDETVRFKYTPQELNKLLEEKGYLDNIRDAMIKMKSEKLNGMPIHAAFLTGGASRMHFIRDLVKECWEIPDERIPKDNAPSLMISRGIALFGRSIIRSGGTLNTKELLAKITANASDIFTPFAESLTVKVTYELERSVVTAFNEFRDCESDVSLNDLQERMKWWIEQDTNSIGEWASECYQKTFEEKTADIRAKLDSIVSEFSHTSVQMGSVGNISLSLPQLDMRGITAQMEDIGTTFTAEAGSITEAVASAAIGGAIGYGLGMLLGGPLAWLLIGGYFLKKMFLDEEESEEQKKQKAMAKDLDKSARQQICDAFFAEKGVEVANKIATSVHSAIYDNPSLKKKINEQSLKVIRDYAQECINQTRLMVE